VNATPALTNFRLRSFFDGPGALYLTLCIAAALVIAFGALAPASLFIEHWARRDVEMQTDLAFRGIRDRLAAVAQTPGAVADFDRIAGENHDIDVAFCDGDNGLRYASPDLPPGVDCADLPQRKAERIVWKNASGASTRVSIFPLDDPKAGRFAVAPNSHYLDKRISELRLFAVIDLAGLTVGFGLVAIIALLALRRSWLVSLRAAIGDGRLGSAPSPNGRVGSTPPPYEPQDPRLELPINDEINSLLAELRMERKFVEGIHVKWSPETLHMLLQEELPGAQVLIVSNREPYIHNWVDGKITLQIPASGLVSALEPVMRACGGVWIAHGGGSADHEACDSHDRLMVPPDDPAYSLRRVWLTDEEQDGYYYGFANEGMWPLCHIAFVRPAFREQDWAMYKEVNERFAAIVAEEATCENPIVLVQDYHFALLPRMIRKRLPKATIVTFWHIPWPNSETFGICPWRNEILDGLLGSSIVGFHTRSHCSNFLDAVDRFIESRIDHENSSVTRLGRETLIRPYPISIEWPPRALATQAPVAECRATVRQRYGLASDVRIVVGVERFDYTKGILDRMHAIDDLLTEKPEWRGKVVLIQAAAPTREKLASYASLQKEAESLAAELNSKYADYGAAPIRLVIRHHEPHQVFELFRAADICIVSSLHDGMNLVAKEFVAARDDGLGVLILSSFAGASRELTEALIVNPYDTHEMAKAFDRALNMGEAEQRERMSMMCGQVGERNVYRWAAQMLLDSAWLRRRERVAAAAAASR
jgi:trehalose 6-phosphate synthase